MCFDKQLIVNDVTGPGTQDHSGAGCGSDRAGPAYYGGGYGQVRAYAQH